RRFVIDPLEPGMRVRRAHESHMHHARQHHVSDILAAALREPRQIRPRYRATDVGIRPVERGETGWLIPGDFHRSDATIRSFPRKRPFGYRFPDAVQRETVHRRSGIVAYSESVKVQRTISCCAAGTRVCVCLRLRL